MPKLFLRYIYPLQTEVWFPCLWLSCPVVRLFSAECCIFHYLALWPRRLLRVIFHHRREQSATHTKSTTRLCSNTQLQKPALSLHILVHTILVSMPRFQKTTCQLAKYMTTGAPQPASACFSMTWRWLRRHIFALSATRGMTIQETAWH